MGWADRSARRGRIALKARLSTPSPLAAVVALNPLPAAAAGQKLAFLIGLDDYGHGRVQAITRLGYWR